MLWARAFGFLLGAISSVASTNPPSARSIDERLSHLTIDAEQIYRVRDVRLNRGGVKIYLNDGVLAFASTIEGKVVAAVFTTRDTEAGDAEVLAMPPNRSERQSLASYTKTPNLNDHFGTAVFFFSDNTMQECLDQLGDRSAKRASELASDLGPALDPILQNLYPNFDLKLVESVLDGHKPGEGFFYGTFGGRDLGRFNLFFDPTGTESVILGRVNERRDGLELWSSFDGARTGTRSPQPSRFSNYRIHTTISESLRLSATADFEYRCDEDDGRSLRFDLSDHLSVTAASLDGQPAEFFEHKAGSFLLVGAKTLTAGPHEIAVSYEGEVIRHTKEKTYFVEERNTWYPHAGTMSANFDLTFQCPQALQLVSTGELISNTTANGIRTVHRRTPVAENVAGFNLGEYFATRTELAPYKVEVFSNRSGEADEELGPKTAAILRSYSEWWSDLPFHSIAVSPISGYFGQGFPGLIYLSDITYVKQDSRPANLRTPRLDSFFSSMLLPHEIAHQWWGNLVVAADYRAGWFNEAMATHSALEYVAKHDGEGAREAVLTEYKKDLQVLHEGKSMESLGPVDFGVRLIDIGGREAWHTIAYEKGAWILRMLQARLGDAGWRQMQLTLLQDFASRPLTNDAFRQAAARYLPPDDPDKGLQSFFETWIYSTGIPHLTISKRSSRWEIEVSRVESDFSADIPIECHSKLGRDGSVHWIRAAAGTNVLPATENNRICRLPRADRFLYIE